MRLESRAVDRQAEGEVAERLANSSRKLPPQCNHRRVYCPGPTRPHRGPRRPRQFDRRRQQALRRTPTGQKRAIGAPREKDRAVSRRLRLCFSSARVNLGRPTAKGEAIFFEGAGFAVGPARAANRRPNVHQRLCEIARAVVGGKSPRHGCDGAFCLLYRLFESDQPSENSGDVAIDRRGSTAKSYRRDCRRCVRTDAGKRQKVRFVCGKAPAPQCDFLRAGVQIAGARVIAETGEGGDHLLAPRLGEVLDGRPSRDKSEVEGSSGRRCGLLEQDFRKPDAVRLRNLALRRPPRKRSAMAVPPP